MAAASSYHPFRSAMPHPDPNDSDSGSSVHIDDDSSQLHAKSELTRITRDWKDLNLQNDYRPHWTCTEAFREKYQNWCILVLVIWKLSLTSDRRDGILRAAHLTLSEFNPVYIDNKRVILIEVRHPSTQELLGFIRFQSNKDGYCVGGLQMVNFGAVPQESKSLPYCACPSKGLVMYGHSLAL
jgi:hypothetical protein